MHEQIPSCFCHADTHTLAPTHSHTLTHTCPTFKYMTWWEFGIAHVVVAHALIKWQIYLQDKQRSRKQFARTAPGPTLQHFATLLFLLFFCFFFIVLWFLFWEIHPRLKRNSKPKRKEKKKKQNTNHGGFGQYNVALYIYWVHQLHKYGSNTE